jgi:hypothetical protein
VQGDLLVGVDSHHQIVAHGFRLPSIPQQFQIQHLTLNYTQKGKGPALFWDIIKKITHGFEFLYKQSTDKLNRKAELLVREQVFLVTGISLT